MSSPILHEAIDLFIASEQNVDIYICIIQLYKVYFPAGENYAGKNLENLEIPQTAQRDRQNLECRVQRAAQRQPPARNRRTMQTLQLCGYDHPPGFGRFGSAR